MKSTEHLFDIMKNNLSLYSNSQKNLAKYIQSNYQKAAFATIKELSELSGISEATIVRFVKFLGFKGYPSFQKEIRRVLQADLKGNERFKRAQIIDEQDDSPLSKIIHKEIENLSHIQDNFQKKEFKKAVSAIQTVNEILIIGTRSTASLAYHFWFGLMKLKIKATRITSITTETLEYINKMDRESLVIVIGFPRYLKELVDILEFSKEKGLKTLALTDSPFSPLIGDFNLYAPAESLSFIAFHGAPMVLINGIIIELSLLDKKKTIAALTHFDRLAESKKFFI